MGTFHTYLLVHELPPKLVLIDLLVSPTLQHFVYLGRIIQTNIIPKLYQFPAETTTEYAERHQLKVEGCHV